MIVRGVVSVFLTIGNRHGVQTRDGGRRFITDGVAFARIRKEGHACWKAAGSATKKNSLFVAIVLIIYLSLSLSLCVLNGQL